MTAATGHRLEAGRSAAQPLLPPVNLGMKGNRMKWKEWRNSSLLSKAPCSHPHRSQPLGISCTGYAGHHVLAPPEPLSTLLSLTLHPGRLATVDPMDELVALELLIMSANGEEKTSPWGWALSLGYCRGCLCLLTERRPLLLPR